MNNNRRKCGALPIPFVNCKIFNLKMTLLNLLVRFCVWYQTVPLCLNCLKLVVFFLNICQWDVMTKKVPKFGQKTCKKGHFTPFRCCRQPECPQLLDMYSIHVYIYYVYIIKLIDVSWCFFLPFLNKYVTFLEFYSVCIKLYVHLLIVWISNVCVIL